MPIGEIVGEAISSSRSGSRLMRRERNGEVSEERSWRQFATAGLRVVCLSVFLVLLAALVRVQIFQGQYFRALADGNRVREVAVPAARGIIFDRDGRKLVTNLPAFELRACQGDRECTVSMISKDQAISLQTKGLPAGTTILISSNRSYPYGEALAHLLGYVSEASADDLRERMALLSGDQVGRGGVEEAYDGALRGQRGKELVEVDALGQKLRTLGTIAPRAGEDVTLSVDLELQKVAYEQIKDRKAAVVALDPRNGEVLALVSSPSFDPNLFTDLTLPAEERMRKINGLFNDQNHPLFDRAVSGTYPPGSTFKIISATAGLETGKIGPTTTIVDPGILIIGPYKFPNWKFLRDGGTQGVLNVTSAIRVSNDIFFYKVGEAVGVDGLADWALRYGLAKNTGVDLPGEASGLFPTKDWREKFARDWYLGDTYHLAIGQGGLLVTPLQVSRWTSAIANGGKLCQPHVRQSNDQSSIINDQCQSMGISRKTVDLIKQGMVEACSPGGTGYPLFNFEIRNSKSEIRKIQIACKTGTAEFGDPQDRTHAWLTAYAPAEDPTIAVTVLVEAGGEGSDVAAPMVKKILEEYFSKLL